MANNVIYGKPNRAAMKEHLPEIAYQPRYTLDELKHLLSNAAGIVKLYCGAANNAAYLVMGNAFDEVRKWKGYRQQIKMSYKLAIREWHNYEHNLVYARVNRFFCMGDMDAETRKKYGDITNQEYYEYWCGLGCCAYEKSINQINVLKHKYRLSLEHHGMEQKHAKMISWVMTAMAAISTAVTLYHTTLDEVKDITGLPLQAVEDIFRGFDLQPVLDKWERAMRMTIPEKYMKYELDEFEKKNLDMALYQLAHVWSDTDMLYGSIEKATMDFSEVFRTKGEFKKALRLIKETKQKMMEENG